MERKRDYEEEICRKKDRCRERELEKRERDI